MKISLATKRRWNWKVLLVLVGLVIPAALAQLAAQGLRLSGAILATVGQNMVIYVLLPAAIGLLLGNRIGLGMPFVESWARHEPDSHRFRYVAALSVIAGIAVALLYQFMDFAVFRAPMNSMFAELGIRPVEEFFPSPLNGFLLGFGAGVLEEVLHRLFGLTLLAWLGGLLFHESDGRPKPAVLWVANLLIALEFAAGHVAAAFVLGWPADPLVIIRGMLFNTVAGMTFGWLFFTFGLESAMVAHFITDAVFYTLLPLANMPDGEMGRILATAGVSLAILLALAWGWRTLRRETRIVGRTE